MELINYLKIQDLYHLVDSDPLVALPKLELCRFLLQRQLAESGHSSKRENSKFEIH